MKKIIINPHNCSRKEYKTLITYLNNDCWDFYQLNNNTKKLKKLKAAFLGIIDLAEDIIHQMPHKGDKCSDSQRICLQQAINEFSYTVNGIEKSDLKND